MGSEKIPSISTCLVAGGIAGTAVDIILFPLDTLKTRLQSSSGFVNSGGFRGLYSGLSSTLVGSAPGAALFFLTYESMKQAVTMLSPKRKDSILMHVVSSSLAEISACSIRVPIEVLKQRMQVFQYQQGLVTSILQLYKSEGALGFYRGFQATLQREIPFACLQFPLYEVLKSYWSRRRKTDSLEPWRAAICGSVAGGITGAITTPLDVIKTRTMLSGRDELKMYNNPLLSLRNLIRDGRMFAGVGPRVVWISIGGFIFFGAYEKSKEILQN